MPRLLLRLALVGLGYAIMPQVQRIVSLRTIMASSHTLSVLPTRERTREYRANIIPEDLSGEGGTKTRTSRAEKLRALNWIRQTKSDLASAEFALKISSPVVDYDTITKRLERDLEIMSSIRDGIAKSIPSNELEGVRERLQCALKEMIACARAENESKSLKAASAMKTVSSVIPKAHGSDEATMNFTARLSRPSNNIKMPEFEIGLFLREDGTVDWDEARTKGGEVAKFGQELWGRINGKDPLDHDGARSGRFFDVAKRRETIELPEDMQQIGKELRLEWESLTTVIEDVRSLLRKDGAEIGVKDPQELTRLRQQLRKAIEAENGAHIQLRLHELEMGMEWVYSCIEQDITDSMSGSTELRLLVAEFGFLDQQLQTLNNDHGLGIIMNGELELVERELANLKLKLSIDIQPSFWGRERIVRYLGETTEKLKKSIDFYVTGTKLYGSDVLYALKLIHKALQGYTLKPREVQTLRRSGKDMLTIIPTLIILLIPFTPAGHLLVFSFIQRFFPDFFPTTFTERRQKLTKMFNELEKVDTWVPENDAAQDFAMDNLRQKFMSTLQEVSALGIPPYERTGQSSRFKEL